MSKIKKQNKKILFSIKVWLAIYPSITIILFLFEKTLSALPVFLRTFVLTLILVPWMVYIAIPFVDSVFNKFRKPIITETQSETTN